MINIYFKHWKPKDIDAELSNVWGIRPGKHSESLDREYRAWDIEFFIPNKGIYIFTFTNNHKNFYKYWEKDWNWTADWQLFGGTNK